MPTLWDAALPSKRLRNDNHPLGHVQAVMGYQVPLSEEIVQEDVWMKNEKQLIKIIERMQGQIDAMQKQIETLLARPVEPIVIREKEPFPIYPVNPSWPITRPYWDHGGMCACPQCVPTITFTTGTEVTC